jgi:hypothetical protein
MSAGMAETGDPSGGVAMQRRRCAACGARFRPRPQIREQRFCSQPDCQRERRRRWKRRKRRTDPDYRDNQARAQRAWCERHRDYWREYQQLRNGRRGARQTSEVIAKRNASKAHNREFSGTYVLRPVTGQRIAKGNAWTVTITAISKDLPPMP